MRRLALLPAFAFIFLPALAWAATNLSTEVVTSTAFIVNYSETGAVVGYGSAFFVTEDTVVTNRHVLEKGDWHRVYAVGGDEKVILSCYAKVIKERIMLHPDDDVAYLHAPLPCKHGAFLLTDDPLYGDPLSVLGFPYRGEEATLELLLTTGTMLGRAQNGWFATDAQMDAGSSGGPVLNGSGVLGVAVAKGVDESGGFIEGYFIPSSVIEEGLIHSTNILFHYEPRSSSSSSSSSLRSSSSSSIRSSVRSSSRSSSSQRQVFRDVPQTREGYRAIATLQEEGIISGYSDGTFRPDASMNRAEFVKILVAGFRPEELRDETRCFSDVRDEWFAPYVCAAERLGWIGGHPDGTFHPADQVNRAEAIKIVTEAFGGTALRTVDLPSDVRGSVWYRSYVAIGVSIGIIDPDELFHAGRDLTREQAAIWIYEAEHN